MSDDWRECPFVNIGDDIAVYDVTSILPRARKVRTRRLDEISKIFVHHSGALNRAGYAGLLASTKYVINHKGFRSSAYHFWLPFRDCYDDDGHGVIFQALGFTEIGSHVGGLNRPSIGIALQGNLRTKPISTHQKLCLPVLIDALQSRLPVTSLLMHCEASEYGGHGKKSCPGITARGLIEEIREQKFHVKQSQQQGSP